MSSLVGPLAGSDYPTTGATIALHCLELHSIEHYHVLHSIVHCTVLHSSKYCTVLHNTYTLYIQCFAQREKILKAEMFLCTFISSWNWRYVPYMDTVTLYCDQTAVVFMTREHPRDSGS